MAVKKAAAPVKEAPAPKAAPIKKAAANPEVAELPPEEEVAELPPEEEVVEAVVEETNLYEAALAGARKHDPNFAARHAKENDQVFIKRLLGTLSEVSEEIWNALPEGVQEWYNASSAALENSNPLPELPGFTAVAAAPVKRTGVQELAEKKQAKVAAKAAKAAETGEKTKRLPPTRTAPLDGGKTFPIRVAVVSNPEMSVEGLRALLEKQGHTGIKASTLSTLRGDTLATMRAMRSAGVLK